MAEIKCEFMEQAIRFGPGDTLVGIAARPVGVAANDLPAVVILNTGMIHRVGHHRMYVSMSREFARAGHAVLRFDFFGVGDSGAHSGRTPLLESNLGAIRAAIDWLQAKTQSSRFILIGLCAGADHAVLYGHSDDRVVGLVLLDPYIPTTARYFMHYLMRRLRDWRSWRSFRFGKSTLVRKISARVAALTHRGSALHHLSFEGADPSAMLEEVYERTVRSQVRLFVVCTGGNWSPRQTYREQFLDAFAKIPFGETLRLEYFEECDHTFALLKCRTILTRSILAWLGDAGFVRGHVDPLPLEVQTPQLSGAQDGS